MDDQPPKPTHYIIQDKHFSLGGKFIITDDADNLQYTVDSTLFVMGDKLIIYDNLGNELIKIRQENLHLHPTYNVYSVRHDAEEMHLASIKRTGPPYAHRLEISAANGEYLIEKIDGKLSHDFLLSKGDEIVATVRKASGLTTSVYWIDIASDREDYRAFLMAMVIVLSCAEALPGIPLASAHENEDYAKII